MAHIREVRPDGCEVKFLVGRDLADGIREWARTNLAADIHGGGPFGDEYRTTSIYLDTDEFDVFHRRGSFARSKYRVRRYGDASEVFLERKLRQPRVLAKRRTSVPVTSLSILAQRFAGRDWDGLWFQRRLETRALRPVCQMSYTRMARSLTIGGETARLTLDADLRAVPTTEYQFQSDAGVSCFGDRLVLELKYRGAPPTAFRQLVELFALTPRSASKYRTGLSALRGESAPPLLVPGLATQAFYA